MSAFSKTWSLLEQEGYLAQACLCNGLTALRNANIGDKKGLFYSAFFELSIGFERTMKLVIILDYMARNKLIPPDSKVIEGYGHKLISLFGATRSVCANRGLNSLQNFGDDSLSIRIISFLDNFAHPGGRYSNINKLTGHKLQIMADPLAAWGEIANRIVLEHASTKQRQRAELNGQMAQALFGENSISLICDLDQQQTGIASLYSRASELDLAAKYAIFALVQLIASLREILEVVSRLADEPGMEEFFQFAWPDKNYVMRKKRWP